MFSALAPPRKWKGEEILEVSELARGWVGGWVGCETGYDDSHGPGRVSGMF